MKIKALILLFLVIALLFTAACIQETSTGEEGEVEEQPETGISDVFEESGEEVTPPSAPE